MSKAFHHSTASVYRMLCSYVNNDQGSDIYLSMGLPTCRILHKTLLPLCLVSLSYIVAHCTPFTILLSIPSKKQSNVIYTCGFSLQLLGSPQWLSFSLMVSSCKAQQDKQLVSAELKGMSG